MIELSQILSRCQDEQLVQIVESAHTIMKHLEFSAHRTSMQLACENQNYWQIYSLNILAFQELAMRFQGNRKVISEPIPIE